MSTQIYLVDHVSPEALPIGRVMPSMTNRPPAEERQIYPGNVVSVS